jgi:sigma-54 dependent transcriptional regulator, acetoin dehydrogenase operon transcriptional activator AcoR
MTDPADRKLRIAAARAAFLGAGERVPEGVSDVVAASWRRSASAGVGNASLSLHHYDDLDVRSRLVRCAQPVIDRLTEETADLALSIALTDSGARILTRTDTSRTIGLLLDNVSLTSGFGYAEGEAGTNGIGTVLESGQSVHIQGPEHFVDALQAFACAGAPIRDPITGRIEGVVDISCLADHSSPLMHSLVRSAAHEIERGLLVDHSQCQQALFDTYLRVDARSRDAVMAVGDSMVMMNRRAQLLLTAEDQATLQEHARFLMARHDAPEDRVELPSGVAVRIRGTRIMVGTDIAGLVVVISLREGTQKERSASFEDFVLPQPMGDPWRRSEERVAAGTGQRAPIADGQTPSWRAAVDGIESALRGQAPLLVMGESGTGKFTLLTELFHAVHRGGRSVSFDAIDVSSTTYDDAGEALRAANVPTLYVIRNLDQLAADGVERLGNFILEVVEAGPQVNVAATLSDASLDSGLPFQELLPYFQTAVTVPPLRQRSADIGSLVIRLLHELAPHRDIRLTDEAMRLIARFSWPRNVRMLEEALRSGLAKRPVGVIEATDLPGYCHTTARRTLSPLEEADRDAVIAALREAGGNRVQAAKALGLARSSLYRRLKEYGITTV